MGRISSRLKPTFRARSYIEGSEHDGFCGFNEDSSQGRAKCWNIALPCYSDFGAGLKEQLVELAKREHRSLNQHSGARTLVLERETEFRDRIRGECLQPWGVGEARQLGVAEALRGCANEMRWVDQFHRRRRRTLRRLRA